MYKLPILIILVCGILAALYMVLKRNRRDEKNLEESLDAADDEEALRARRRPGGKNEL
jgi:hypothetical protein